MSTATVPALSDAARCRETLIAMGATADEMPVLGIPAPMSSSHHDYRVGYYSDNSILIWARGHGFELFDEERTYYRDTLEHLAGCLAIPKADRAAWMKSYGKTEPTNVCGIVWDVDGSFVRLA